MRDFQQRNKIRKIVYSWVSIVALFFVFIFLVKSVYKVYGKHTLARQNSANAEKALLQLTERKEILEKNINKFETDIGLEEEIRDKFRMTKNGEKLIIMVEENASNTDSSTIKKRGVWEWIKDIF